MMARRGWFILLLLGAFFAIPVQRRFFFASAPRAVRCYQHAPPWS